MEKKKTRLWHQAAVICVSVFMLFSVNTAYTAPTAPKDIEILDRSAKAFAQVVKGAKPAVVHISVDSEIVFNDDYEQFFNHPFFEHFFGPQFHQNPSPRRRHQQGTGSGFIISADGYILTNNHVVENADKITVTLANDKKAEARLIGTDPKSDVALIKVDVDEKLPTIPLGDSETLEVGEWVIAIGNPFGLNQTVTVGIVSAKGRSRVGINEYENFIQTDAAINPGNSGGPLLNIHGEVIGINSALYSRTGGYMGIGFAIPVNMVKYIVNQLKKNGKVTRGLLGIALQDLDDELADSFGLDSAHGILVTEVIPDSPADKAGVKERDVIIKLNKREIRDSSELRNRIALTVPGTTVELVVIRDGKQRKIKVTVSEQPDNFGSIDPFSTGSLLDELGIIAQDLNPDLADQLNYHGRTGVIINDILPDSPAERSGLKPGQLIEEVNKVKIGSMKELQEVLERSVGQKRVLLRIRSGNYSQYIALRTK